MDKINISKEKQKELKAQIKVFFLKEREEEIGDLAAEIILDFFYEKIAPAIYNQAVYDCYQCLNDKIGDILELQKDEN